jgi:hypothetical protein
MALRNAKNRISYDDLIMLVKSPEHAGFYFQDVTQLLSTFLAHFSYFSTGLIFCSTFASSNIINKHTMFEYRQLIG